LSAEVERAGIARAALAAQVNPDAHRLTLSTEDGAIRLEAVILPSGRGYLMADTLRPLPQAETYQLWALGGEAPISIGLLGPDPRIVTFMVDPRITSLAITAERAGGEVAPNLPPVAAGEVQTV
jgi:hypothetical protein